MPTHLDLHGWIALGMAVATLAVLASGRVPADITMLGVVLVLVATGTLAAAQGLAGFANEGMLTVAVLFVVAAGLQRSGAMELLTRPVLGPVRGTRAALLRMSLPVAGLSGFLNNTPMVAMLMPQVVEWGRRIGISPSKLLIPLSYATVLGGMLTMIGTSTNLVVAGLLVQAGHPAPGLLWPTLLALPVVAVGLGAIVLLAPRLLPDRVPVGGDAFGDPRQYTVILEVVSGGPLDGRPLSQARVGDKGLMPVEVQRGGDVIPAPGPDLLLHGGDRLVVAGPAVAVLAVSAVSGLVIPAAEVGSADAGGRRRLFEVVVSDRCPLIGATVGDGSFRARYAAAIIAIARHGERVGQGGAWDLRAGDTLLVEARSAFGRDPQVAQDFWLVSEQRHQKPPPPTHPWLALGIMGLMCAAAASGMASMLYAGLAAAIAMIGLRLLRTADARSAIDLPVLVTIACSLALGKALESTGAAAVAAGWLVGWGAEDPWLALALIYVATAIVTELITNNAAAALLLPIALATAQQLGVAWQPFAIAVMFAASASFATPIGYQTNLMVWGPGGYRFSDFVRLGMVLQVLVGAVTIGLIPLLYPFAPG
jgi:di/tricarboxylate transporter